MNAQEAINGVQNRLDGCKNDLEFLKDFGKSSPTRIKDCERQIKELTIVLESARLFHEYSVPEMFSFLKKNLGEEEAKTVKTVYGVPIEKLGIEVDDND